VVYVVPMRQSAAYAKVAGFICVLVPCRCPRGSVRGKGQFTCSHAVEGAVNKQGIALILARVTGMVLPGHLKTGYIFAVNLGQCRIMVTVRSSQILPPFLCGSIRFSETGKP